MQIVKSNSFYSDSFYKTVFLKSKGSCLIKQYEDDNGSASSSETVLNILTIEANLNKFTVCDFTQTIIRRLCRYTTERLKMVKSVVLLIFLILILNLWCL